MVAKSRSRTRTSHARPLCEVGRWAAPLISNRFETAIGSSVVEQFVIDHTPGDILRELVQNEFDAKGHQMQVTFGQEHLNVSGSGRPVDKAGWERLSVILGTGDVISPGRVSRKVQPKENGIGSKNFGLRSLFLFGDRIYLRSAGKMAVLDLKTLGNQLVPDRGSHGRPGVSIDIPYHIHQFGKLEPFTVDREQAALDQMATEIPYTLVKLALPRDARSLNRLVIVAERSKRHISWRQDAETLRCRVKGVTGIRRHVRLVDNTDGGNSSISRLSEIEFRRRIAIPPEFAAIEFPTYFRSVQNHCYVGISVSTKRDRIDLMQSGRFYYPLASRVGHAGQGLFCDIPGS